MGKFFKIFIGIVLSLVLIFILSFAALVMFVDPNHFKGPITKQVHEMTGQNLTIDGNLKWSLFPWLGIQINEVALDNPSEFKERKFISFKEAHIEVKLLPLLHNRVIIKNILLKDAVINLIKLKDGSTNWSQILKSGDDSKAQTSDEDTAKSRSVQLTISNINIENATLNYQDLQNNQSYSIKNLNIKSSDIGVDRKFPLEINFLLTQYKPQTKVEFNLAANAMYQTDARQLKLNDIYIKLDKSLITGNIVLSELEGPMSFNLKVNKINLDKYLSDAPASKPPGAATSQNNELLPTEVLKNLNLQGSLNIGELIYSSVPIQNFNLQATAKNGLLNLPLTATIHNGSLNGNININAAGKVPVISIQQNLKNIDVKPLTYKYLKDANVHLSGTANASLNLTTQGNTTQTLLNNLNGKVNFAVVNGTIQGLSIINQFNVVQNLITKTLAPAADNSNGSTPFTTLSGNFFIKNGVATNNDLVLQSPLLKVTGNGSIDLRRSYIDYLIKANTTVSLPERVLQIQQYLGGSIPIRIVGPLSNVNIYPDAKTIMNAVAQTYLRNAVQKQIGKSVQGLGNQLQDQLKNGINGLFQQRN